MIPVKFSELTINQARAQLKFNRWNERNDWLVLDTETTGLRDDSEICEISVIDPDGHVMFDSLVRTKDPIPEDAERIHGISNEMIQQSPTFPEVWEQVYPLIRDKLILIYNDQYDRKLIRQSLAKWGMDVQPALSLRTECVMETYADLVDSDRWLKLSVAAGEETPHRALGDCQATLKVIRRSYKPEFTVLDYYRRLALERFEDYDQLIQSILQNMQRLPQYLKQRDFYLSLMLDDEKLKDYIRQQREKKQEVQEDESA